jgi:transcription initiation factor TFIID TATA-box-binding protein
MCALYEYFFSFAPRHTKRGMNEAEHPDEAACSVDGVEEALPSSDAPAVILLDGVEITPDMYSKYTVKETRGMKISMCNATALLGNVRINLAQLVLDFSASWNPTRFATATVRMTNPKCCILIFCTGKVVCTGAKSEMATMRAFAKFIRIVRKTYMNATLLNLKIELMSANCSVGYPLNLLEMHREYRLNSSLDDLFPALRLYKKVPSSDAHGTKTEIKITLLVFVNGNIVVSGAKSRNQLLLMWETIQRDMPRFRSTVDEMIAYQIKRKERKKSRARIPAPVQHDDE